MSPGGKIYLKEEYFHQSLHDTKALFKAQVRHQVWQSQAALFELNILLDSTAMDLKDFPSPYLALKISPLKVGRKEKRVDLTCVATAATAVQSLWPSKRFLVS